MIRKIEIAEKAHAWGLGEHVVEKDYVIGWLLMGVAQQALLQSQWIFKGGTCLKKCYLDTNRFSEDLDFTLTVDAITQPDELVEAVREVCEWVTQESGLELPTEQVEFRAVPNPRGSITLRGRVYYRGPLQQPSMPRVRFDLTTDELIILEPISQPIEHPYSDLPANPPSIRCYPLEEIFAEKTRALGDRGSPRDLYDIIQLYHAKSSNIEGPEIRTILEKKCDHRGFPVPSFAQIADSSETEELRLDWEHMLGHQLPDLPPFEAFWNELSPYFEWLEGKALRSG